MAAIIDEAQRLADQGFKEIMLTGIHLGFYGRDLESPANLAEVITGNSGD